ncbi:hypothetical protein NDU88_006217 [Pleurodeles waltl]|uniref:Uncharacterized protein n=1 Tax=Pleurodeles waltl TaxID=8319 RepID=A0AAV7RNC2_PLEWA|nr:hypothetical protein NDU88_006217 [Pleurodeles waltl]
MTSYFCGIGIDRCQMACYIGLSINYDITVVAFLAAADAGLFDEWQDQTQILTPEQFSNSFCNSIDSCESSLPIAMEKWKLFFEKLMSITPVSDGSSVVDTLLHYLWDAHEASIGSAVHKYESRLNFLSDPEKQFNQDWATAINFIGDTRFRTDYETISSFLPHLPHRILRNGDRCPLITDFTAKQNMICQMLKWLNNLNTLSEQGRLRETESFITGGLIPNRDL